MLLDAVEWLGHSGFRIRAGAAVVYIDPYRVGDGPAADLILITHGHYDHFSPQDVGRLTGKRTLVVAPAGVAERLSGRVQSIAPGEAIEPDGARGVEVPAIAAYNTSKRDAPRKALHPRDAGAVGYEEREGGERPYHSSDTDVVAGPGPSRVPVTYGAASGTGRNPPSVIGVAAAGESRLDAGPAGLAARTAGHGQVGQVLGGRVRLRGKRRSGLERGAMAKHGVL